MEVVHLTKQSADERVGVSFAPDVHDVSGEARIAALHPSGAASHAGLQLGDRLVSINGRTLENSFEAASVLRETSGDLWLCVERGLGGPSCASERVPRIGRKASISSTLLTSCTPWPSLRSFLPVSIEVDLQGKNSDLHALL